MPDKSRQQRANHKARKAKGKAIAAKQYRSWLDRPTVRPKAPPRTNALGLHLAMSAMRAIPTRAEMEAKERFLCGVFGEEFRP
jgi:hypothetical protein